METISQRQLRNDNAEIIRGVEGGASYVVTRRGVPVAVLGPVPAATDLRCDRPATTRPNYSGRPRVVIEMSTAELLDEVRDDR